MAGLPEEIAAHVARAADELAAAAEKIPSCNCEHMDATKMAKVIADVGRAEVAAAEVHKAFRGLEKRHGGGRGLATLETQSLDGCTDCVPPVAEKAADLSINKLADEASAEVTGGQCC